MYAVVRRYKGARQLFDELARRQPEVESLIRSVPGFRAYYLMRSEDGGGATITVCDDRAGTQESSRMAAAWVRENVPQAAASPPEITEGEVLFDFGR